MASHEPPEERPSKPAPKPANPPTNNAGRTAAAAAASRVSSSSSSAAAAAAAPRHARRPPASQSVSLVHAAGPRAINRSTFAPPVAGQPSPITSQAPCSDRANPPSSPSSLRPKQTKYSSGESSDAGCWFEATNNNVGQSNPVAFDNDPPFFLRNSSSSETPPDAQQGPSPLYANPFQQPSIAIPYRPGMLQPPTDGSSTEDYRSVIDDLTIANKRLKKKLRKYEKLYDAHLQSEKLFEVRVHGLPPNKKKELEETLKRFAMSIDPPISTEPAVRHRYEPDRAQLHPHNTTASSLASRNAEPGYVSMSASGQNSSTRSGQRSDPYKPLKFKSGRYRSDIRSYLQEMPPGLFPMPATAMTEKSKKKLVVRRLEQIFTGKGAVGGHHQPLQQQEVSHSAAAAERKAFENTGREPRKEGMREARIMSAHDKHAIELSSAEPGTQEAVQSLTQTAPEQDSSSNDSPDQRPTRPLDLDPYRAQVPSDNMEYIRHLGFSPPDPDSARSPEEGHGWIYLNLLVNMAQLHTINVTTDFVKDAIKDYSDKLELSHDERKIRWKGGHDISQNSSDTSISDPLGGVTPDCPHPSSLTAMSKSRSTNQQSESDGSSKKARRLARLEKEKDKGKFSYTPLFFHKEDSVGEESSALGPSSMSSPFPAHDSSAFTSSGVRTDSSRRRDDGPIIFYNKANFCTDLSGDARGNTSSMDPSKYHKSASRPVGTPSWQDANSSDPTTQSGRGPLTTQPIEEDRMEISDSASSGDTQLDFSPDSMQMNTLSNESPQEYDFEASGLGGVEPRDNFAIYVVSRKARVENSSATASQSARRPSHAYPTKLQSIIKDAAHSSQSSRPSKLNQNTSTMSEEIISTTHKALPASALPPASFLPFTSSSSDADSDLESVVSEASEEPSVLSQQHPIALQNFNIPSASSSDVGHSDPDEMDIDEEDEEGEGGDDIRRDGAWSGSVDFLATARILDPSTIQTREREYDADMADRLAEEIPAGSSAATAGGGSGYCSPSIRAADDSRDGESRAGSRKVSASSAAGPSRGASLKRTRTSDSLIVHGKAPKLD